MSDSVYTISKGKSLASGYRDRWLKRLKDQESQASTQALIDSGKNQADSKPHPGLIEKAGNWVKDTTVGLAKSVANDASKAYTTVEKGVVEPTIEAARAKTALNTGNKPAFEAAMNRANKSLKVEAEKGLVSKAGQEGGITSKAGAKDALKGGLKYAQYAAPELKVAKGAGLATKIIKRGVSDAAINTGLEAGSELVNNGKLDAKSLRDSAALGGVLGSFSAARKGMKEAKAAKNAVPTETAPPANPAPAGLLGDGNTPTDPKLLNARNGDMARPLSEIDAELNTLQTNRDPNMSNEEAKARFQQLQDERATAAANEAQTGWTSQRDMARTTFENNGLPNDPAGARAALDNFDANPPASATKPSDAVTSAEDVINHPSMPPVVKEAARQIVDERSKVMQQMHSVMSPIRKQSEVESLNQTYDHHMQDIQNMPPQQQAREMQSLNDDYNKAMDELDAQEAADAPHVDELTQKLNDLHTAEQHVLLDTNTAIKQNPDTFRTVDPVEHAAQRQALEENLQQAERFNHPEQVVTEVASSPDPVRTYHENPDVQPAFQAQTNIDTVHVPDYKPITGVRQALLKVMSPSQILEKMGMRDMHSNIIRAESALNLANSKDANTIMGISERLKGNPELQTQIIDYLQGTRKTLSAADTETADMIRSFLDEKKAGLEKLGYKTLDDYFPHMFDKTNVEAVQLFKPKGANGDIKFGNLKERKGDSQDFSKDITKVLAMYASGFNKKVHLEPALKPLEDIKLQDQISQNEVDWVNSYMTQLKGNAKGDVEKGFDQIFGQGKYRKTLGVQRTVSALATMGLNPGTAIRNMTQMVNTVANIGPRYSTVGMMDGTRALLAGPKSPEWEELRQMGIIDGGVSHNYYDDLTANIDVQGKLAKGSSKAAEVMMGMVRGSDIALRAQAYYGAKALGRAKGLTGEKLKNFAQQRVVDTQFMTSKVDMPVGLNGPGMRSLTQLATFSAKQAGFMKRQMGATFTKDANGYHLDVKQMGSLLAAGLTMYGATELLKPTIGFDESEWIPFYAQVAPFLPGGGGSASGTTDPLNASLYRSPLVTLLAGDGKSKKGLIQALQSHDMSGFFDDQWSSVVPAGVQAKKSIEGYNTVDTGISKNNKGAVRYIQDQGNISELGMSIPAKLQASIFGQYSTPAGKRWIDDKFPTLSDSQGRLGQTADEAAKSGLTMDTAKRPVQQTYYDYYAATKAATGRDKAFQATKDAAKSGNVNQAARLAKEYNDKLNGSLGKYWKSHQDLPDPLKKDLAGRYINVQQIIDSLGN